ncbi:MULTISPECIES: ribonucleoside-diphosphate reductase subunit alpha [Virgibacillus]|uniref:Ribonucleoside-diphosphate reductase n=1 Tax=Virgibacillus pantothenticus TaxID=1473 RepID=A0A0L0QS53_VIRPA|nr:MULTISPECIES: ribonucleoside-diphosphate reductase subunit alpha [Virgibacillus]API91954.1 ribonucleoside-diphosphate reductase subunit alpha [Virgibacillus sp. 6R]KNE21414.1 ribonucleotide-diphosphate reductase subunit alpha [Virgibacillus pantothenticus]MBS7430405.1 ribonucleoside-diphosphate reductase subunit alpha [Virgibacillus sp. 19R1-5]MBU8567325.1 ribonucleoside-diphosphate reductase subunit alpha [Virgibacillus pantothenticus]MBU8598906.1 ribonucleoside-diphosphate reductase subun
MIIDIATTRDKLVDIIDRAQQGLAVETEAYKDKAFKTIQEDTPIDKALDILVQNALENMDESAPDWTYVASRIYLQQLYHQARQNRQYNTGEYGDFYQLITMLTEENIYKTTLLEKYSKAEIDHFAKQIDPARDLYFTYLGLHTLTTRYLATDHDKNVFELPQERWMIIAMTLMQHEDKANRTEHVLEAYWALSNLYMTVATPTLANAGKTHGQLSSCFIDTVDDSLQSIYDSNTDIAKLSKNGGGIGVYMGKIRSRGSSIKGFKGMSSGVVPWIKQLNNTAVNVDQLGTRKGAIAVYLDVWHRDIEAFLDLKLNNGDERMRAHDIFTGVTLPDLFMEQVEKRGDWYLFDPHEVRQVMGYSLEDFYDEAKGNGTWREKYEECVNSEELSKRKIPAIDIMKRIMKSQLESGTPFMFYRDEVNRQNSNSHKGMIYCSNLCTEITQNQSPSEFVEEFLENENTIVKKYKSGDYVVCNLSSINLGKAVPDEVLDRLIKIQVRMLDNVIDINTLPIMQAQLTNKKYRAIGLGTFGWHHLLAHNNMKWETEEAVQYADELYERIAFLTIQASMELSKEKGSYPAFSGSKWSSGEYFDQKGYDKTEWLALKDDVKQHGIRNGYLMAVAPNSTTAMIAGSTASIDPIFKPFYYEEKKDFKIPVTAPDLTHKTYDVYRRSAYIVDQRWSVKQNAARQRHVDQSLSFNFYVPNTIRASILLDLHLQAWREGLKTTYYVRSTSNEVEECEWCQS